MRFGKGPWDRALAIGVPVAVLAWFAVASGRLAAVKRVNGISVTPKVPRRPGARGDGPVLGEGPGAPDGPLEGVVVGADECELDYGPHRFARAEATGELSAELERWGAGSEPFAVMLTGGEIRELTAGPGGARSTTGPYYERLGTIDLPFAPPGGATGTGYVLSRSRKNWTVAEAWDAVNPVKNALGGSGFIDAGKAVAALARGRHTTSWVVARYEPETCSYEVLRVDANPALDALKGRLG